MGVQGLSTYIRENQAGRLLHPHRLHDTRLVVDANNLYHYLYYNFKLPVQYGGQYDLYARHLRNFFQVLQKCKIELVMIFDGAYNEDDRKFETTLKRFENRLSSAARVSQGSSGGVLPILARQVFVEVLKELKIQHLTSDFEADNDLACVANYYQCPVLSNDSDFYVYNVRGGFIPLDFLDITERVDDCGYYIGVKIYYIENLLEKFKCKDHKLIGLWATIIGNDFIGSERFIDFYSMMNLPDRKVTYKQGKKNTVTISKSSERIHKILDWLKKANSFQSVYDRLLHITKSNGYSDLDESIMRNIDMYSVQDQGLLNYIEYGEIQAHDSELYNHLIPHNLLARFRLCEVEPDVFNILLTKRIWLNPQSEDFNKPSSYSCSARLRKIVFAVMEHSDVTEYDRDVRNVVHRLVKPETEVEGFGKIPSMDELGSMSCKKKTKKLLLDALECYEVPLGLDNNIVFLVALCTFWVRNATSKPSLNLIRSLILSFVSVEIVEKLRGSEPAQITEKLGGICPELLFTVVARKFGELRYRECFNYDESISILHSLAEFQSCFLASTQLYQVLCEPLVPKLSAKFFNGQLIHNLTLELNGRPQPAMYITELLGGQASNLWLFFEKLMAEILARVGKDKPVEVSRASGKSKKKKKKSKKNEEKTEEMEEELELKKSRKPKKPVLKVEAKCDLTNKFGLLTLGDENESSDEMLDEV